MGAVAGTTGLGAACATFIGGDAGGVAGVKGWSGAVAIGVGLVAAILGVGTFAAAGLAAGLFAGSVELIDGTSATVKLPPFSISLAIAAPFCRSAIDK